MVFSQETNQRSVTMDFINSIWWNDSCQFLEVDAFETAGGLFCIWNPNVFCWKEIGGSRNFRVLWSLWKMRNEHIFQNKESLIVVPLFWCFLLGSFFFGGDCIFDVFLVIGWLSCGVLSLSWVFFSWEVVSWFESCLVVSLGLRLVWGVLGL
ncbi:hypothetical protein RHGRI_017669 [Rhododendron griersonianum]|uniref:Transmembrane protein n=1 Tax=Rhododendron griersonianum TaxID=479676 RepID=A0AAV6JYN1_9ERIC|nr:hypothetical protein RHGRI_017669 [Rhododendron griersonianum]